MIDPNHVPPVAHDEMLARFILHGNEFRKLDGSLKPELFMPYKLVTLSVNRHRDCTEDEIWNIGNQVAEKRKCSLYGRGDIKALSCRIGPLDVVPNPLPDNANHADVTGYPAQKEEQKSIALKLAATAGRRIAPPATH